MPPTAAEIPADTFFRLTRSCPQPPELVALGEACCIAGHWRIREHGLKSRRIDEAVLLYCVGGAGWLRVGKRNSTLRPGQLGLCPAGIDHGYGCDPDIGWEIWWVHFRGARAEALAKQAGLSAAQPVGTPGICRPLIGSFSRLLEALSGTGPDVPWTAAERLHGLLLGLTRWRGQSAPDRSLTELATDACLNLDELARRAGYSKYHFCRRFKAETGRTPWQYVLERRLEQARELLLDGRLSIKEIAARLGFPNADYFARLFARSTGVTPRRYRGRLR